MKNTVRRKSRGTVELLCNSKHFIFNFYMKCYYILSIELKGSRYTIRTRYYKKNRTRQRKFAKQNRKLTGKKERTVLCQITNLQITAPELSVVLRERWNLQIRQGTVKLVLKQARYR